MNIKYNWQELPDFTVNDFGYPSPHQRGDYGWDSTTLGNERHAQAIEHANGILSGTTKRMRVRFFVNDVTLGIGLSGTFGQSRRTRTFYAHNLMLPVYTIQGQCLDQNDYTNLTEFIHQSHQDAISNGMLLQLNVLGGGLVTVDGGEPKTMKGQHDPIVAYGLVEGIERKHERWKYAPEFEFGFAVVEQAVGIYSGASRRFYKSQRTFLDILKEQEKPFSQAPKPPTTKTTARGASGKTK